MEFPIIQIASFHWDLFLITLSVKFGFIKIIETHRCHVDFSSKVLFLKFNIFFFPESNYHLKWSSDKLCKYSRDSILLSGLVINQRKNTNHEIEIFFSLYQNY